MSNRKKSSSATTRRTFLKTGAGLGACALFPHTVLRAAAQDSVAPLRLGFIGLGRMGHSHVVNNFCKRPDVLCVALCDVNTLRREQTRRELIDFYAGKGGAVAKTKITTFADHRELLARDDVDAVVISTPDHWHAPVTLDALAAGKDVYCEKPLTHTVEEAFAVMAAVKQHHRILQTGSQQRSNWPEFRTGAEMVVNGVIGDIQEVRLSFGDSPRPCDLPGEEPDPASDWDRWLGPAPARPYSSKLCPRVFATGGSGWRPFMEYGGGGLADFGAHHIDIARWAMGLDEELPVRVLPPEDRKDMRGARLVYANGVTFVHTRDKYSIEFLGETGRICLGRRRFELWRGDGEKDYEFISPNQVPQANAKYLAGDDAKHLYPCTDHYQDFLNAVRSRKRPIAHEDIGARTAICCHFLNLAYRYRQPLEWDAEKNTFAPGGGDPAWLTKDYREGYALPSE